MSAEALRVFHNYQNFLSHARCARDYQRLLRNICTLVDDPGQANVAILHHEPSYYPSFVHDVPALHKAYRIGYCVWESDTLPASLQKGIAMMDELWTASAYCHEIFSRYHHNVTWIPHVVACEPCNTPQDDAYIVSLLGNDPQAFDVLTITQDAILRKNTSALRGAFARVAQRCPGARLVIKTTPSDGSTDVKMRVDGPIVYIDGKLTLGALHALYARCPVYASAHCSEGWGLPMSDAMVMRRAVVGTKYSGNLDFMTPANSFLVEAQVLPIHKRDQYYLFDASMRWAYVHRESLELQLCEAYRMWRAGTLTQKTSRAAADITNYNDAHVEALIRQRLESIAETARPGSAHVATPGARGSRL